jgi:RNA polymerase sigma-70 factor (ECF subfamily)
LLADNLHNETELLKLTAEGDEHAFASLFHAYHQSLGSYIFKLTDSRAVAEEIVQEAFIKAWQQRSTLVEVKNFKSWIFMVSRNHALNTMRNRSRQLLRHNEWLKQQDSASEMENSTDVSYLNKIIAEAIASLPAQQQRAYLLSRENAMTHAQIAAEMQISPNTVKRHITIALQTITSYLRTHYPDLLAIFWLFFEAYQSVQKKF